MKICTSVLATLITVAITATINFTVFKNATAKHSITIAARKHFSQVFIFSDSQSDIGNDPASLTMYGDNSTDDIFFHLYPYL